METQTLSFLKIAEHHAKHERINRSAWMVQAWQTRPAAAMPVTRGSLRAVLASLRGLFVGRSLAHARKQPRLGATTG